MHSLLANSGSTSDALYSCMRTPSSMMETPADAEEIVEEILETTTDGTGEESFVETSAGASIHEDHTAAPAIEYTTRSPSHDHSINETSSSALEKKSTQENAQELFSKTEELLLDHSKNLEQWSLNKNTTHAHQRTYEERSWGNVKSSFENAQFFLRRAREAYAAQLWDEVASFCEVALEHEHPIHPYSEAAKAYALGKSIEGNAWHSAGRCFFDVAYIYEKFKADDLEKNQSSHNALELLPLAYQQAGDCHIQSAKAYAWGDSIEAIHWSNVAASFYNKAVKLEESIKADISNNPSIAEIARDAANNLEQVAELYRQVAVNYHEGIKAYSIGNLNVGNDFMKKSRSACYEAIALRDQTFACTNLNNKIAEQFFLIDVYEKNACEAKQAGDEEASKRWKRAAEELNDSAMQWLPEAIASNLKIIDTEKIPLKKRLTQLLRCKLNEEEKVANLHALLAKEIADGREDVSYIEKQVRDAQATAGQYKQQCYDEEERLKALEEPETLEKFSRKSFQKMRHDINAHQESSEQHLSESSNIDTQRAENLPVDQKMEGALDTFLLAEGTIDGPQAGQRSEVRILKTNFNDPLIWQESIRDLAGNIIRKREMVADHLLINLPEGETEESFLKKLGGLEITLKRVPKTKSLYRISFDITSAPLHQLPEMIKKISEIFPQAYPCPDFIKSACYAKSPSLKIDDQQWNFQKDNGIDAQAAWNVACDASAVQLAIIDTGIRSTHQEMHMWEENQMHGFNAIENDDESNTEDQNGHGTHCAGIVGAVGESISGVAPNVKLMAFKFMNDSRKGTLSAEIACIEEAIDKGAQILNCSFSGEPSMQEYRALQQARERGIIVVAAAGNAASDNDLKRTYPACYSFDSHDDITGENYEGLDNIVSVAATKQNGSLTTQDDWGSNEDGAPQGSNYGKASVHLAAPGHEIYSTSHKANDSYCDSNGTSSAAPHVTGALGLMRTRFPYLPYQMLINALKQGVDKTAELEEKTIFGGRLNAGKALKHLHDYLQQLENNIPHDQFEEWSKALYGDAKFAHQIALRARQSAYSEEEWQEAIQQLQDAQKAWNKSRVASEKWITICNEEKLFSDGWPENLKQAKQEANTCREDIVMFFKKKAQDAEALGQNSSLLDYPKKYDDAAKAWNQVLELCLTYYNETLSEPEVNKAWFNEFNRAQNKRIKYQELMIQKKYALQTAN